MQSFTAATLVGMARGRKFISRSGNIKAPIKRHNQLRARGGAIVQ
jgi:hypothetical protein